MGGGGEDNEVAQVASHPHALRAPDVRCTDSLLWRVPHSVQARFAILTRAFLRMWLFEQRQDQNVKALYLGVKNTHGLFFMYRISGKSWSTFFPTDTVRHVLQARSLVHIVVKPWLRGFLCCTDMLCSDTVCYFICDLSIVPTVNTNGTFTAPADPDPAFPKSLDTDSAVYRECIILQKNTCM